MTEQRKKIPGKWLKWLEDEAWAWKTEGIIDENQAGAILARYEEMRAAEEADRGSKLVTVLAVMGSLLVGIGVITFFAANWQEMPKWLKVSVVFGGIIAAYGIGYYLAFEKQNYPRVGRAVIFLGSILYGAGIWLIAQIFHINAHYPNGVLFWAAGILPVALVCRSLSVLIQTSLLLTFWTVLEQTGFEVTNYFYLPLIALTLGMAYWMRSRLAVGLSLPGIAVWAGIASAVSFGRFGDIMYAFLLTSVLGLLIYVLGNLHKIKEKYSLMKFPYQIAGLFVFLISLYVLSFKWLVRVHDLEGWVSFPPFYLAAFGLTALGTFFAAAFLAVKGKDRKETIKEGLFVLVIAVMLSVLTFTAAMLDRHVFLAVTNIFLFISIVALVIIGYANREPVLINFGLVFFVLDVVARYFDFFWDMLDKSVFFMVGGMLLLVGGTLLERHRRKIVREMKVKNYAA